jgi:predicted Zn-dependent protease
LICLVSAPPATAHEALDRQISSLTLRIEADPEDAALWLHRGELHRLRSEWRRALADYRVARGLEPSLDAVDLCLGELWLDRGRARRAARALDRFVARHPGNAFALAARARARAALGKHLAAADDYTSAISAAGPASPLPDYYLERARAQAAAGPPFLDAAIRGLEEGAERLGRPVSLLLPLIDLEARAGRDRAAQAHRDEVEAQKARARSGGR